MNTLGIVVVLLILIILIFLLVLLITNLNKKNKTTKKTDISVEEMQRSMPSASTLFLAPKIESISNNELHEIAKKIFDPFRYIDYKNMTLDEFDKKEWHSWQIGLLLLMFKRNEEFFIASQEKYFHSILLNSNENDMKSLMTSVIKKYNNYVDSNKSKDILCKEYIWTNKDASTIFYFLANYKNYKK